MIEATAEGTRTAERRTRPERWPARLTAGTIYVVLLVLCALAGFWAMFSQFAPYDDEGLFDYGLKLFIGGHSLYNTVYSEYGPFYYELFRGLFAAIGHGISTDAGRFVQLFVWLGSSLGLGLAAHRLTRRLAIGVTAFATSFALMSVLTSEPMHPEALVCGLVTVAALVIAFGLPTVPRAALISLGAVSAALTLTKINVGGYAIVSIAYAVVVAGDSLVRLRLLRRAVIIAFVLVGPAVMVKSWNTPWAQVFAVLAGLSALSLVFVATPTHVDATASDESPKWARWLISGFVACLVVVLAIVFALGTTPGALVDQIIVVPTRQVSALTTPIVLGGAVLWWSLAATGLAWTSRQIRNRNMSDAIGPPSLWGGVARALAGVAILLSLGNQFPFAIAPVARFAIAMPLAWVAALPSRRDGPGSRERLARLLIPSLAVLQCIIAYPVASSQVYVGSLLLVLCGAICLADAWAELVAWNREQSVRGPLAATGLTAIFMALALGTTFEYIVQPLQTYHDQYRANTPLSFYGASRLRLPGPQAAGFEQIVAVLRAQCSAVITLPALYSFNLWSGLPEASSLGGQPYWTMLSSAQQRGALAAARARPRLCAVRSDIQAAGFAGGGPPPRVPLVAYVEDDFTPIARVGQYLVERRRP